LIFIEIFQLDAFRTVAARSLTASTAFTRKLKVDVRIEMTNLIKAFYDNPTSNERHDNKRDLEPEEDAKILIKLMS
jgi:hypothetical protein